LAAAGADVVAVVGCTSAAAGVVAIVGQHLQVGSPSFCGTCSCRWCCRRRPLAAAGADGVVVVHWHLQLQVVLLSSCGTCSCKCCHCRPWVSAGVWWPSLLVVEVVVVVGVVVMVVTVVDRGGW